jgi:dipeptidyl aminopeptidase/acylaminoacyl peptidase
MRPPTNSLCEERLGDASENETRALRAKGRMKTTTLSAALLSLGLFACHRPKAAPARSSDADVEAGWLSVAVTLSDSHIVVEQVSYQGAATDLVISGQICRPNDSSRHAVVALAHGGFAGLAGDKDGGLCVVLARKGYVAIESSYRGEDHSAGQVEVCLGEVDDVNAMLHTTLAQPYADGARVGLIGSSHGGCVALRALERGAPVRAAADGFGITDLAQNYDFWQSELDAGAGSSTSVIRGLVARLHQSAGSPGANPEAYRLRSPLAFGSSMPRVPLLIAHGTADTLVSIRQSCAFAAKLGDVQAFHLDSAST